jgi:hypothetical protein
MRHTSKIETTNDEVNLPMEFGMGLCHHYTIVILSCLPSQETTLLIVSRHIKFEIAEVFGIC